MSVARPVSPPMGWNSWDAYGASVTEEEVLANADVLASRLKPFGWEYVVVDIQWYEPHADGSRYHPWTPLTMDEWGRLWPAGNRFPSAADGRGFAPLARAIHDRGLKFGIHILRGIPRQAVHRNTPVYGAPGVFARDIAHPNSICPWNTDMYGVDPSRPESQAYYDSLFRLYAEWGVDFVKVDDIAWSRLYGYHRGEVELVHRAIARAGRPMVLSLSPGPAPLSEATHLKAHATMWRLTDDLWDRWGDIAQAFDVLASWAGVQGPGSFPDADMLPLGHIGIRSTEAGAGDRWTRLTPTEQRTMVTLWALARSPLILGCELRDLDAATYRLLTAPGILRASRESYGNHEAYRDGPVRIWLARDRAGDAQYLGVFNTGPTDVRIAVPPEILGEGRFAFEDLWGEQQSETGLGDVSLHLPAHGSAALRVQRI
jgi:alpha-galactosidase